MSISSRRSGRDESGTRKVQEAFLKERGVGGAHSVPFKGQLSKLFQNSCNARLLDSSPGAPSTGISGHRAGSRSRI